MIKECKNCWYFTKCQQKDKMETVCLEYEHTLKGFKNSNIPPVLWSSRSIKIDPNNKKHQELKALVSDMNELYNNNRNILLYTHNQYGDNLNGWMIKTLQNYIFAFRKYQFNNENENSVFYIDAGKFKEICQLQVDNKELFLSTINKMQGCELLGIDNIDKLKGLKNFNFQEKLVNILEYRQYRKHKSNIFTSHIPPSLLDAKNNDEWNSWINYLTRFILKDGINGQYEIEEDGENSYNAGGQE